MCLWCAQTRIKKKRTAKHAADPGDASTSTYSVLLTKHVPSPATVCIQRDVQERERALSLECNNVDVDALLYLHNKYIDDKFQTMFYEVLCKTEAMVAEDWPRYPNLCTLKTINSKHQKGWIGLDNKDCQDPSRLH